MKTKVLDFTLFHSKENFYNFIESQVDIDFSQSVNYDNLPDVLMINHMIVVKENSPILYNQFIDQLITIQQSRSDKAILLDNSGLSEKQKMLSGLLYQAGENQLTKERDQARQLFRAFNQFEKGESQPKMELLDQLFGSVGVNLFIEPPFYCDYGYNIYAGNNVFMNFNCVLLDVMPIKLGNNVMFGPNVQVLTATHPTEPKTRSQLYEYAKPIAIGNNCWLGGGAIICPGVSLGNNVIVGAGAVVTKSFGDNVFIAGNPARVIREL